MLYNQIYVKNYLNINMNILNSNYSFALIKNNNHVILFNDSVQYGSYKTDRFLTNVTVELKNGILYIKGKEHEYKFTNKEIKVETLEEKPSKFDIRHSKGCKLLGIKPYDYVIGSYAIPNKIDVNIIMNNFIIDIKD